MIHLDFEQTNSFMKDAVPLARQMEGNWSVRMKLALNQVIIKHLLNKPLSPNNIQVLLKKGVSYRRICKNYGIGRKDLSAIQQKRIV
ncbi:hypothetical protein VO177_04190 [Bacillus velezensis]|uniref:hypothetical protein n=1 Tax=Bacillus velezensis TaxID=492670 RepID=UPI002D78F161|nr:hypothetical protein [Bacillus velezensis]WRT06759.1 hypothetical protein VO177_04190 [Bacillus velezensis]